MRVMTFNIRYRQGDTGRLRWDRRRALVVSRIRAFDPDIAGLQECNDDTQGRYVKGQLAEWDFHGVRSEDPDCPIEMTPVLIKPSAFSTIDRGQFWLSETPSVPGSRSWDSGFARVATWARLEHRESGRALAFLNVHVDYEPQANERSAHVVREWIATTVRQDPLIIVGDFNAGHESTLYRSLACSGTLVDVFQRLHPSEPAGTFHDYGHAQPEMPLDWILASEHFEPVDAHIDRFVDGDRYPSDHYPVTATLRWRPPR